MLRVRNSLLKKSSCLPDRQPPMRVITLVASMQIPRITIFPSSAKFLGTSPQISGIGIAEPKHHRGKNQKKNRETRKQMKTITKLIYLGFASALCAVIFTSIAQPVQGNYPNASVPLSTDTTVPSVAPLMLFFSRAPFSVLPERAHPM